MTMNTALEKAIAAVGTQAALAKALGVSPQHVWNWVNRDKEIPAKQAIAIERATNGEVTRHELRPDLYPDERKSKRKALDGRPQA